MSTTTIHIELRKIGGVSLRPFSDGIAEEPRKETHLEILKRNLAWSRVRTSLGSGLKTCTSLAEPEPIKFQKLGMQYA